MTTSINIVVRFWICYAHWRLGLLNRYWFNIQRVVTDYLLHFSHSSFTLFSYFLFSYFLLKVFSLICWKIRREMASQSTKLEWTVTTYVSIFIKNKSASTSYALVILWGFCYMYFIKHFLLWHFFYWRQISSDMTSLSISINSNSAYLICMKLTYILKASTLDVVKVF